MATCKAKTSSGKRCKNQASEGSEYCYIKSHNKKGSKNNSVKKKPKLNKKQERFCQLFVSKEFFGNGVQSYIEAYNIPPEGYNAARVSASDLLTKPNICDYINELLEQSGLNDEFVDKQLLFMITQNADFTQKMAAIREYNKLKSRITDKKEIDLTGIVKSINMEDLTDLQIQRLANGESPITVLATSGEGSTGTKA